MNENTVNLEKIKASLNEAFSRRGGDFLKVAKDLNAQGLRTTRGNKFTYSSVYHMLEHHFPDLLANRQPKRTRRSVRRPSYVPQLPAKTDLVTDILTSNLSSDTKVAVLSSLIK